MLCQNLVETNANMAKKTEVRNR